MDVEMVSRNAALREFRCTQAQLDQLPYAISKNGYILYEESDVRGLVQASATPRPKRACTTYDYTRYVPALPRLMAFCREPKKMYPHPDYSTSEMCALPDHVLELISTFVIAEAGVLMESMRDLAALGRTSKALRVMYAHGSRVLPEVAMRRFDDVPSGSSRGMSILAAPPVRALCYLRDHMEVTQAYIEDPMRLKLDKLNGLIRSLPPLPWNAYERVAWSKLRKREKVGWTLRMLGMDSSLASGIDARDTPSCMMLLNYLYDRRLTQVLLSRGMCPDAVAESDIRYAKEMYDVAKT